MRVAVTLGQTEWSRQTNEGNEMEGKEEGNKSSDSR